MCGVLERGEVQNLKKMTIAQRWRRGRGDITQHTALRRHASLRSAPRWLVTFSPGMKQRRRDCACAPKRTGEKDTLRDRFEQHSSSSSNPTAYGRRLTCIASLELETRLERSCAIGRIRENPIYV